MTMLTGDFAADRKLGGLLAETTKRAGDAPETAGEGTGDADAASAPDAPGPATLSADDLPEDARLYLRHVEGGESIRSIAREIGCHASTVLRRIRRFEERRDEDPLLDRAVAALSDRAASETRKEAEADVQLRRILRRLAEPGAVLAVASDMDRAIVTRHDIRTAVLDRVLAEEMALQGLIQIQSTGRISRYVIAQAGRDQLREMLRGNRTGSYPCDLSDAHPVTMRGEGMAEAQAEFVAQPNPHADRHRSFEEQTIEDPETGARRRARINIAESPMMLMARRREKDGSPFLGPELVAAGERLREDFELAQMGPRVSQNWDRFLTAGSDRGSFTPNAGLGGSEAARDRVALALRELGPGMGDVVLRVCCFLEGIEATERRLGWSARSGKIVLRLGLIRLDRHYRELYGSGGRMIG